MTWSPPIVTYSRSGIGLVPGSAELFILMAKRKGSATRHQQDRQCSAETVLGTFCFRERGDNLHNRRREDGFCLIHKKRAVPGEFDDLIAIVEECYHRS